MLVLTRRINQAIYIGDDVTIRLIGIQGNKVRLAISAPPEVRVDREEVRRRLMDFELLTQSEIPVSHSSSLLVGQMGNELPN